MAYDEDLANRVRALVPHGKGAPVIEEKRMFGGIAVMLNGNIAEESEPRGTRGEDGSAPETWPW
jgi:hypothetical protein